MSSFSMNATYAAKFATLALAHVRREYPNKLDHVMLDASDVQSPRALHPIFYGSFDWHSCVHGYWLLARIYRKYPDLPECTAIRTLFDEMLTAENVSVEVQYAAHPARANFERPYGWAWALHLCAELVQHDTPEGKRWSDLLVPLGQVFARRFVDFLPRATYPIRVGTHFNSAFALVLAMDYAECVDNERLLHQLRDAARRWFQDDVNANPWEPGGDDFLSGTLTEALCMRRALSTRAFEVWFERFLPRVASREPNTLFIPATVSDRTDGKIAHLDGLNLSRAWCWRVLAREWPATDPRRRAALDCADAHLQFSLPHVAGDYAGEHWLATYAMLALDAT